MKYLLIGDLHVKLDNLDESRKVIRWITGLCKEHGATPIFMGDQYDSFAIMRTEVLEFWVWAYSYINTVLTDHESQVSSISLVGNHDLNADGTASAMAAHEKQTLVIASYVSKSYVPITDKIAAIGFIRNNEDFIQIATNAYRSGFTTILCHAEFNGAQFENGFYAPHGIPPELCPPATFISGHIHLRQKLTDQSGRVIDYIGTPRYLTRSDVGEQKGVVLWDTESQAMQVLNTPETVAVPFREIDISATSNLANIPNSGRVYVNIHGSKDFIKKTLSQLPDNVKVRTFPLQEKQMSEIKESDGIPKAFATFAKKFLEAKNVDPMAQSTIIQSVYQKCPWLNISS